MEFYFKLKAFLEYCLPLALLILSGLVVGVVILKVKFNEWKERKTNETMGSVEGIGRKPEEEV